MKPHSLTARLVAIVVLLVAIAAVGISTATTLAMRANLEQQLDSDVHAALQRTVNGPGPDSGQRPTRDPGQDILGQELGTVTAVLPDDDTAQGVVLSERDGPGFAASAALTSEQLETLSELPESTRTQTVELPALGTYRIATERLQGGRLVVGLPLTTVDDTINDLIRWEVLATLLGIAAAAGAGTFVVRRQLAPLREVAATAHAVAELPLSEGAIDLTARVPERLTDERNEVGQVGSALNTLLDHVETSLAVRHRSEQQVRQFVADASHELRTPLATIAGYTELARRQPAATATALDKVESESARMTSLVEDLLLLARLDSGRPLADDPVDLTKLLLEAVGDARVIAPDHTWRLVLPDEPVELRGDEQRLHQVVTNLLTNARKHTPAGTTVTVTATSDGFTVHDDGPGFPAGLADHAFERFVRADEARTSAGGVGLGLSLVDAIISAHGGRVTLTSLPGDTAIAVHVPAVR